MLVDALRCPYCFLLFLAEQFGMLAGLLACHNFESFTKLLMINPSFLSF